MLDTDSIIAQDNAALEALTPVQKVAVYRLAAAVILSVTEGNPMPEFPTLRAKVINEGSQTQTPEQGAQDMLTEYMTPVPQA